MAVGLVNCIWSLLTMLWILIRFNKPGMSWRLKRSIRRRYLEYVLLYCIFSWPICLISLPYYEYNPITGVHIIGTNFVDTTYDAIILLSGAIIAITRFRDRVL